MTATPYSFYLIIVAAGSGTRLSSDVPKQYMDVNGKPILLHTLEAFEGIQGLKEICVVVNPEHSEFYTPILERFKNINSVNGGKERINSVYNGLSSFSNLNSQAIILIHDAARPFVSSNDIYALLDTMNVSHAASLVSPVVDTLCRDQEGAHCRGDTVQREGLFALQTPQAFRYDVIMAAHEKADRHKSYTDDTSLVSDMGEPVTLVEGSKMNFKITTQDDLYMAEAILSTELSTEIRSGLGYDVHAFDEAEQGVKSIRPCGVDIPYDRKLKGHSDADVGLHTLTDAILGAIGEGDIGLHFPPSNNDFKDMDSAIFLEHAMTLLRDKGGELVNADVTLICERPKVGPYREQIISRMAEILGVSEQRLNIKATTTEKLGFTGRKEGIAAQAIVSVRMPVRKT